jgi:1,4-alpha-glucan branching enzyme
VAIIANLTPLERSDYVVPLPRAGRWIEILNTDAARYSGGNRGNLGVVTAYDIPKGGKSAHARLLLPPLSTLYLEWLGE